MSRNRQYNESETADTCRDVKSPLRRGLSKAQSGFTLLELIITITIIAALAAAAVPVARNLIKREKEKELRRNLREIRAAIDSYKFACDTIGVHFLDKKVEDNCYPPTLEVLVEGVHLNTAKGGGLEKSDTVTRYLRRIPNDPFTGKPDWGLRSTEDDKDSGSWGGQNVYDVYSNARGLSLDGKTYYREW